MIVSCRVCGEEFNKLGNKQCCSTKCSKRLIAYTKGVIIIKECKMCLTPYRATTNSVCCSDKCRLENKRQSRRRSWHKNKPERYGEWLRLRLWRIKQRKLNEN